MLNFHCIKSRFHEARKRQREREAAAPPRSEEETEYREQKKSQSSGGHPNIPVNNRADREYVPARSDDEWTGERIRMKKSLSIIS